MLVIVVRGGLLAVARFDQLVLPWLTLLGAVLPVLVVPMAVNGDPSTRPLATDRAGCRRRRS
ncbi:hypothetical protein [Micromonospora sp. NBC_01638]|uniref:hypothetical protein n=1 Tax=Micromonospora sp. NBC_01638 TaxID=2975982 RepID=UPI00386ECCAE|nr:hypothetical protein OG811_28300 [Micromonospora sp. NBC_01638]